MWTKERWSKVYFSDEGNFDLVGSDGKQYVQHQTGERHTETVCKEIG